MATRNVLGRSTCRSSTNDPFFQAPMELVLLLATERHKRSPLEYKQDCSLLATLPRTMGRASDGKRNRKVYVTRKGMATCSSSSLSSV